MLRIRSYNENDESLILAVMTNQLWLDSTYKIKKTELRAKIKEGFYDLFYGDKNDFNVKCICLDTNPSVIVSFICVLDNVLVSHFIKRDFSEEIELKNQLFDMLKESVEFDRFQHGLNSKFAKRYNIIRRVENVF